mgnify:CR=1 FL=1
MYYIIIFACFVIGFLIGCLSSRAQSMGVLRVIKTDSDDPYLFVELYSGIADISAMDTVKFLVKTEKYVTRK